MNTRSSPIRSMKPVGSKTTRRSDLTRASPKTMPHSASLRRTSSRASTAVRSTSTLASAFSRNHSTGVPRRRPRPARGA